MEIIGFWLISVAITFFIVFLMGDSLDTKEKIEVSLGITAFLTAMILGAFFIENK